MALITAYLRIQSLIFFLYFGLFAYSSYKDPQYLSKFGIDVKSFETIDATAFGELLIRSFAASLLLASTVAGYAATFTDHTNKKKIVRGIFFFNLFTAYAHVTNLLVATEYGKKFDIATINQALLVKAALSTVFAVLSFLFSFVTLGGAKGPVSQAKKNK